ncbi:MAG: LptF/LptG family permease, partial [Planctomycetota bacterium]
MGTTLFWYVFRDLLRIFLLANAALAGIMSFGGLLDPLTDNGLSASQVGRILAYLMPAMLTYSLPVAALFACTFVYGRLSADNELTACRAAGVPLWELALPGVVMGLSVALLSGAMLSFIVPRATLAVERVVFSNLAQFAAFQIRQNNKLLLDGGVTLYAADAQVGESPDGGRTQVVHLLDISIAKYEEFEDGVDRDSTPRVIEEIYLARQATAFIENTGNPDEDVQVTIDLRDGMALPRNIDGTSDARQATLRKTQFGPYPLRSPLRENTKFMDFAKLRQLGVRPELSRRVAGVLRDYVRGDQQEAYLRNFVLDGLSQRGEFAFFDTAGDIFMIADGGSDVSLRRALLRIGPDAQRVPNVRFQQTRRGENGPDMLLAASAESAQVRVGNTADGEELAVHIRLTNPIITTKEVDGTLVETPRTSFETTIMVPTPRDVRQLTGRNAENYLTDPGVSDRMKGRLRRELYRLLNGVHGEIHARLSFAVSCVSLVLVGVA